MATSSKCDLMDGLPHNLQKTRLFSMNIWVSPWRPGLCYVFFFQGKG